MPAPIIFPIKPTSTTPIAGTPLAKHAPTIAILNGDTSCPIPIVEIINDIIYIIIFLKLVKFFSISLFMLFFNICYHLILFHNIAYILILFFCVFCLFWYSTIKKFFTICDISFFFILLSFVLCFIFYYKMSKNTRF